MPAAVTDEEALVSTVVVGDVDAVLVSPPRGVWHCCGCAARSTVGRPRELLSTLVLRSSPSVDGVGEGGARVGEERTDEGACGRGGACR